MPNYVNVSSDLFEITWITINDETEHTSYAMMPASEIFTIGDVIKFAVSWFDEINDDIMI